jgi:TonB family protein
MRACVVFGLFIFMVFHFKATAAESSCQLQPIMETHTLPKYPKESADAREEGQVLLSVAIDSDGVPSSTQLITTSGYPRLDQAVLEYIKASWRWRPILKECPPVVTRVNVTMDLRDAGAPAGLHANTVVMSKSDFPAGGSGLHGETLLMISILQTVNFPKVSLVRSSGHSVLDGRAEEIALFKLKYFPAKIDDKPADTVLYLTVVWPDNPQ